MTLQGSITNNISNFIDADGEVTLLIYMDSASENSFHDYVSVSAYTCSDPVITTNVPTNVGCGSATFNGSLDNMGSWDSVTVGFEYGTTDGGPYPFEISVGTMSETGAFQANIGSLDECNVNYYYRARAIGCSGDLYDVQKTFTTEDCTTPDEPDLIFDMISPGTINMSTTGSTDNCGPFLEYNFVCIAGGGPDSGWQSELTYQATELSSCASYTYEVQVQDTAGYISKSDPVTDLTTGCPTVGIYLNLQGNGRPASGWIVPINVGFYEVDKPDSWLLNPGSAVYYFSGTTTINTDSGTRAYFLCPGPVAPGTYDVTADTSTTLLNVKRNIGIQ